MKNRVRTGYAHVHSAIDAYSRLAYSEVHNNETSVTNIGFWRRAKAFFESYGITIERVLTDNGSCYRSKDFADELLNDAIKHTFTKPYKPQTNGKLNGSIAPCSTNGLTPGPTAQRRLEPEPLTAGCISTTIIDTTPPLVARPSVASRTWLGRTPRTPRSKSL